MWNVIFIVLICIKFSVFLKTINVCGGVAEKMPFPAGKTSLNNTCLYDILPRCENYEHLSDDNSPPALLRGILELILGGQSRGQLLGAAAVNTSKGLS